MKRRRLLLESLESRTVLSTVMADLAPASETSSAHIDVAFVLQTTDESGQARTTFEAGERVFLNILVEDLRGDSRGVFAAGLDVVFDPECMALDGTITFGPAFPNGHGATWSQPGMLDELFAFGGLDAPGPGSILFARIPFVALAPGSSRFVANPADDLPRADTLVHGWNDPVSLDHIDYGSAAFAITGSSQAGDRAPATVAITTSPVVDLPEQPVIPVPPSGPAVPSSPVVDLPEQPVIPVPPSGPAVPSPIPSPPEVNASDLLPSVHPLRDQDISRLRTHAGNAEYAGLLFVSSAGLDVATPLLVVADFSPVANTSTASRALFVGLRSSARVPNAGQAVIAHSSADVPIGVRPETVKSAAELQHSVRRAVREELVTRNSLLPTTLDDPGLESEGQ